MVNSTIVVIFRAAAPDAKVGQSLVFQKFGRKYPCCCHLCRRIVFQNIIHLLAVVAFSHYLRAECGGHGRHGTCVIVHAVILCVNVLCQGRQ